MLLQNIPLKYINELKRTVRFIKIILMKTKIYCEALNPIATFIERCWSLSNWTASRGKQLARGLPICFFHLPDLSLASFLLYFAYDIVTR